jgi:hypothetical protein
VIDKFCLDCRHSAMEVTVDSLCFHPKSKRPIPRNPVTGDFLTTSDYRTAIELRMARTLGVHLNPQDEKYCGLDGNWFEPEEVAPAKTKVA